jgi:hypothetical protein
MRLVRDKTIVKSSLAQGKTKSADLGKKMSMLPANAGEDRDLCEVNVFNLLNKNSIYMVNAISAILPQNIQTNGI